MKQQITIFTLGLCIGLLVMVNQVCKQKDSMIEMLQQNNGQVENVAPKNLPIVNIK